MPMTIYAAREINHPTYGSEMTPVVGDHTAEADLRIARDNIFSLLSRLNLKPEFGEPDFISIETFKKHLEENIDRAIVEYDGRKNKTLAKLCLSLKKLVSNGRALGATHIIVR